MKAMTIDSTPAARRISALRSSVRNLEEALGSILDVVGNDDYPLDENARDELMRLIGQALVITFSPLPRSTSCRAASPSRTLTAAVGPCSVNPLPP